MELVGLLEQLEITLTHPLELCVFCLVLVQQPTFIRQHSLISSDSLFEHVGRLSPEIYVDFVPTERLKLILSLVQVFQLLLEAFPEPDAHLGIYVAVRETLGD